MTLCDGDMWKKCNVVTTIIHIIAQLIDTQLLCAMYIYLEFTEGNPLIAPRYR